MLNKNAQILVVDDMRMVRKSVIRFLESLGYTKFIEAENGADAITKYQTNSIDFVFMDLVMPIQDGYQALKGIKKINESANIVMITSIADDHILEKCLNKGALGFISKPLTKDNGADQLLTVLDKVA